MSWSNAYVGTPYVDQGRSTAGCDCWGLAKLVYDEQLGLTLPSYTEGYVSAEELREVSDLIRARRPQMWCRVKFALPFDLLLFRRGRYEAHIGIAVDDTRMLHVARGDQAKVETFAGHPRWSRQLVGTFRHVDRLEGAP